MIPIKLTIEGLYSYQERQTIDFELLTSSGLFGILGGVGSGKSSILEAMTYALYGETERLNSRDRRAYNMLNLKSDRAFIEFDFENFEGKVYRCTRELRRNSRNHEDVKAHNTTFYKEKSGSWQPLDHTDAERLIGLSYTNFKRTIIIPQGQFKEFLELGAAGRTQMMKEIFQLQRFDLLEKTNSLFSVNKTELDTLTGRLQSYESVNEEEIEEKSKEFKQSEVALKKIQTEFEKLNSRFEKLKQLKDDYEKLQEKAGKLKTMQEELPGIEQKEAELNRYERIFKQFSGELTAFRQLEKELKDLKADADKLGHQKETFQKSLLAKQSIMDGLKPRFEKLADKRREENDLKLIRQIVESERKIKELEVRSKNGLPHLEAQESKLKEEKEQLEKLETKIENLQNKTINSALLIAVNEWFTTRTNIEKEIKNKQDTATEESKKINNKLRESGIQDIGAEDFSDKLKPLQDNINKQTAKLEIQRNELLTQQKMAEYAHELHDGEACPLCGSKEHPDIVKTSDVSAEIQEIETAWDELLKQKEQLTALKIQVDNYLEQNKKRNVELKRLKEQLVAHQDKFVWDAFDRDDYDAFVSKKEDSLKNEELINNKQKEAQELRKTIQEAEKLRDKYRKTIEEFTTKIGNLKAVIDTQKLSLTQLKTEEFQELSASEIQTQLDALIEENNKLESEYMELSEEINALSPKIASTESLLADLQKRVNAGSLKRTELQTVLEAKLDEEKLESLETVESVLQKELDTTKERETVQQFRLELGILSSEVENLQKILEQAKYNHDDFAEEQQKWEEAEKQLEAQKKQFTTLDAELKRLKTRFEEKKELLKEHDKLSKRGENLRVMRNLFIGSGFVQYISTIYLTQLCDHANIRFHRMTRNRLSLQLNDNGDFEIIDYLNEGRSRSVKTLSGGQAFQVSLSLALALAESVQSNARADKNFFFIDEGFGTQDLESVNIVFETLLNLNKENKIVGVISHVEELKERMPMTLTVVNDPERGSLIS